MTQRRVDWTRQLARRALSLNVPDIQAAFEIVAEGAENAMAATPTDKDMREWQTLAADVATALKSHDQDLSEQARILAGRLRSSVARVSRAPKENLALRPTSRRVLEAILELGGSNCTLVAVRQRTGLSQTHISNVIRALSAQGFIVVGPDSRDGRGRRLTVTVAGRAGMGLAETARRADRRFEGNILVEASKDDRYDGRYTHAPTRGPSVQAA